MRLFYVVAILILIACNSTHRAEPKAKLPTAPIDTAFHKYFPDTLKFPMAVFWDNRYYLRTKALTPLLGFENVEKGIDGFELRLWHLSSWKEAQEVYVLRKSFDSIVLYHFDFSVRLSSWDKPGWRQPNVKISKVRKSGMSSISAVDLESMHIDSLWNYPSGGESGAISNGQVNCGSICIELADRYRYKFGFFPCPEENLVKVRVLDSIAQLHRKLAALKKLDIDGGSRE